MNKLKILIITIILLFASNAWAEWSPPTSSWPAYRDGDWSNNIGFQLALSAPWDSYTQGASVSSGASAAQIQTCLNALSAGQYCYMNAGSYSIDSTELNIKPGTELRGAGMDQVTITTTAGGTSFDMDNGAGGQTDTWYGVQTVNVGSTTVTLSSSQASLIVGDIILLAEREDSNIVEKTGDNGNCSWCGDDDGVHLVGQFVEITAKNGNVLTIDRPAMFTYDTNPEVQEFTLIEGTGISNLTINCNNSSQKAGVIDFNYTQKGWVRNVEVYRGRIHVMLEYARGIVVSGNYFHEAPNYSSDQGYVLWIFHSSSDHFIFNNISDRARYNINFEGGGANVIVAYNFFNNPRDSDWDELLHESIGHHGAHQTMNLYEGNIAPNIVADRTWGSSSHGMIFRNWFGRESLLDWSVLSGVAYGLNSANIQSESRYYSFVGNILGYSSMSGTYQNTPYEGGCSSDDAPSAINWGSNGFSSGSSCGTAPYETSYVHHNYDYINSEIKNLATANCTANHEPFQCCTGNQSGSCPTADTDLPDSLFLTSKAQAITLGIATSGDNWPMLDVDQANMFNRVGGTDYYIPAYRRHFSISDPPAGAPTVSAATIGSDGQTVTVVFSESVETDGYDINDFDLDCSVSNNDNGLTYSSGDGSTTIVFTTAEMVLSGETCTLDYDCVGCVNADDIETTDDATDLETFSNQTVTNNSEQFAVPSPTGMTSAGGVSCY